MFTDLAFIDWVALVFAAVLLAAAAAAGLVAYAATKNRTRTTTDMSVAPLRRAPQHAATQEHAATQANEMAMSGRHVADAMVAGAPAPPIMVPARRSPMAVMSDGVRIEAKSASPKETVATRAAKLRGRPVPESVPGKKRVMSAVEPSRTPAHAPSKEFVGAHERGGNVSIEMDSADGFAARTPGFFEDPVGRHELRYWDGHHWTEYVKEHGERFVDPL